jgi:hypothetical protein
VYEGEKWPSFFRIIGMNSITIYLLQQFVDFHKPVQTVFGGLLSLFLEQYYPSLYWSAYVLVCWLLLTNKADQMICLIC